MHRRTLFKWIVGAAGVAMGCIVAAPAVVSALSPAGRRARERSRSRSPAWRAVGPVEKFALGKVVQATVTSPREAYPIEVVPAQAVYVWRRGADELVVFSRTCTDLGCAVRFDGGSEFYYCPCHGGIFNKSGEPVAGPPQKPLYRYATRVRAGVLEIDVRSVPALA